MTYKKAHPQINFITGDIYTYDFKRKFDLIVLDLEIENNLRDWAENQAHAYKLLKRGGYLITYLMTTDQYGDPDETPALIRRSWKKRWGKWPPSREDVIKSLRTFPNYEFISLCEEERRPYITWVLFKKK